MGDKDSGWLLVVVVEDGFKLSGDLAGASGALVWFFGEHLGYEGDKGRWNVGAMLAEVGEGVGEDGGDGAHEAGGGERPFTGQHFVEHDTERPDIGTGIEGAAITDFGAEVADGADEHTALGEAGGVAEAGDAKVGEAWGAIGGEEDVGWFEVTVDDIEVVGAAEGIGEFEANLEDTFDGEGAVFL